MRPRDLIGELCVALAHRWEPERLFVILTAYFDESGTHAGSPATILSGVMATANQWRQFQTDMNGIKDRFGFTGFHAKEFKARSGEFSGWPPEKCAGLLREMMQPSMRLMEAVTITLPNDVYERFYRDGESHRRLRLDTKYALCLRLALLNFVVQAIKRLGTHKKFNETKLHVVMEAGHKNAGDAERAFYEMRQELRDMRVELLESITFAAKCDPIAIADYLAYGGLAMELAPRGKERQASPAPEETQKMTGMTLVKVTPEYLETLRADLIHQLKKMGKAKFILPSDHRAVSSRRPS